MKSSAACALRAIAALPLVIVTTWPLFVRLPIICCCCWMDETENVPETGLDGGEIVENCPDTGLLLLPPLASCEPTRRTTVTCCACC